MRPRELIAAGLCGLAVAALLAWPVAATAAEAAPWDRLAGWLVVQQRAFHRLLTQDLRALADGGGAAAAWGLMAASLAYGVFHAVGPGHGKAVIATYLLAGRQRMGRGVVLAALSAACQGAVAIALVYGLVYLAGALPRDSVAAVAWSERLSYALIALVGGMLAVRAIRSALARLGAASSVAVAGRASATGHGAHDPGHRHDHCHGPSAARLAQAGGWRENLGIVLSIGLRPCTGAILVLAFASATGLAWAGIAAVAAMSFGTALAVAGLAAASVLARDLAVRLARSAGGGRGLAWGGDALGLAGGVLLVALGLALLDAAFAPAHPLGL